jgi:hypothetical protein
VLPLCKSEALAIDPICCVAVVVNSRKYYLLLKTYFNYLNILPRVVYSASTLKFILDDNLGRPFQKIPAEIGKFK